MMDGAGIVQWFIALVLAFAQWQLVMSVLFPRV